MGKRCIVGGCSSTSKDGVSLHLFPSDIKYKGLWSRFVRLTRADWREPSKHSTICSEHFQPDSFGPSQSLMATFGLKKKATLLHDAVPSIMPRAKRAHSPDVDESHPPTTSNSSGQTPMCPRSAYKKRERERTLQDVMATCTSSVAEDEADNETVFSDPDMTYDTCDSRVKTVTTGCQTSLRPKRKSARTQYSGPRKVDKGLQVLFKPKVRSCGTQTDNLITTDEPQHTTVTVDDWNTSSTSESSEIIINLSDSMDSSYAATSSRNSSWQSSFNEDQGQRSTHQEKKFLVAESALLSLFSMCVNCGNEAQGNINHRMGTFINIVQKCDFCNHKRSWNSQPFVGSIPAGNLQLSAAILFAGAIPSQAMRIFEFLKMAHTNMDTFYMHQRYYLQPTITHFWKQKQESYFEDVRRGGGGIVVAGDGRADSPGHSAKFGIYSTVDVNNGKVVNMEIVQSNEVHSSYHMELEGLKRTNDILQENGIHIESIITDRHTQVSKWVKENLSDCTHYYDIWHCAKGFKKKMNLLAKKKECHDLKFWTKSVTNHMYWVAASTPDGNKSVMLEKWRSIVNHVQNIHDGHGDLFPKCLHDKLVGCENKKKWLKPGSAAVARFCDLVHSRQVTKDIQQLSPLHQTFELECLHSVLNHFAPKLIGFSYYGTICRAFLAALHFEENSRKPQATTSNGQLRYQITFPKYKCGEYSVKEVKVENTFCYVDSLMEVAEVLAQNIKMNEESGLQLPRDILPPPLCAQYQRPEKELAVSSHKSRYSKVS